MSTNIAKPAKVAIIGASGTYGEAILARAEEIGAMSHSESCAFISWRYDHGTWQREGIREAWEGFLAAARRRSAEDCRRVART